MLSAFINVFKTVKKDSPPTDTSRPIELIELPYSIPPKKKRNSSPLQFATTNKIDEENNKLREDNQHSKTPPTKHSTNSAQGHTFLNTFIFKTSKTKKQIKSFSESVRFLKYKPLYSTLI